MKEALSSSETSVLTPFFIVTAVKTSNLSRHQSPRHEWRSLPKLPVILNTAKSVPSSSLSHKVNGRFGLEQVRDQREKQVANNPLKMEAVSSSDTSVGFKLTAVSNRNEYQVYSGGGGEARPLHKDDSLTAICAPIVERVWVHRYLRAQQGSMACYGDSLTFICR
jgi:hypothetical protein